MLAEAFMAIQEPDKAAKAYEVSINSQHWSTKIGCSSNLPTNTLSTMVNPWTLEWQHKLCFVLLFLAAHVQGNCFLLSCLLTCT